jgi:hypothetical protein
MAVTGARPVASPWFLGRRTRPRPRPRAATRGRRSRARRIVTPASVRPQLVAIVIAAALAIFYLSQSAHVAATGYEIDALEAQLASERATHQQLVWEIGEARSPAEITRRARAKLHLVPLADGAVTFAPVSDATAD